MQVLKERNQSNGNGPESATVGSGTAISRAEAMELSKVEFWQPRRKRPWLWVLVVFTVVATAAAVVFALQGDGFSIRSTELVMLSSAEVEPIATTQLVSLSSDDAPVLELDDSVLLHNESLLDIAESTTTTVSTVASTATTVSTVASTTTTVSTVASTATTVSTVASTTTTPAEEHLGGTLAVPEVRGPGTFDSARPFEMKSPLLEISILNGNDSYEYRFHVYLANSNNSLIRDTGWVKRSYTEINIRGFNGEKMMWTVMARDPNGAVSKWTASRFIFLQG